MAGTKLADRPLDRLLADAFEQAQAGSPDADRVMRAFYSDQRVKRILDSAARAVGVLDHKDEALQRLAILFSAKLFPELLSRANEPDNVYKVVYAGAHNVSLSIRKEVQRAAARLQSTDAGADDDMIERFDAAEPEDFTATVHAELDMQRARVELRRRLAAMRTSPIHSDTQLIPGVVYGGELHVIPLRPRLSSLRGADKPAAANDQGDEQRPLPDMPRSPEVELLLKVRKDLDMTNPELATALNVGDAALSSYIYGRVQTIPEHVVSAARALLDSSASTARKAAQRFEALSMPQLIALWDRKLGVEPSTEEERRVVDRAIAEILKVNPITVWRWRTDKIRLARGKYEKYSRLIAQREGSLNDILPRPAAAAHTSPRETRKPVEALPAPVPAKHGKVSAGRKPAAKSAPSQPSSVAAKPASPPAKRARTTALPRRSRPAR